MAKQAGEILRRTAFNTLDLMHGQKQNTLKEKNKKKIVEGVTENYRKERLRRILSYARERSPFYRNLPSDARLCDFPVMTKLDFVDHYDDIISDEFRERQHTLPRFTTSGSTGTPFSVIADPAKLMHVNMNFMAVMELNGFRLGMKRGEFRAWIPGKNTRSPLTLWLTNLVPIDISNMSDASVEKIYGEIKKKRIQCLVAYSSAITALVEYAERHGITDFDWDVEMIFTMGEALPSSVRERAEKLYGVRPVITYGNNENGFIAVSLNGGEEYHIDLYSYYIEILKMDSDEPAEEGEIGRIVVTDFYNRAFPMIRYDTGDTGRLQTVTNDSGVIRSSFTEIYGRRGSLIYTTKGEPLSIHVFMNNMLHFEGELHQVRCVQTDLKSYTLLVNPVKGVEVDEEKILTSYRGYLGQDAKIQIEYVDEIPIQASGKTMVCEQLCEAYLS